MRLIGKILPLLALPLLLGGPAAAYIGLVTLPERDGAQITVYNSADLTLVRERRTLTFKKGVNELEFSWANTLIDPTSIQFEFKGGTGLEVVETTFPKGRGEALVWRVESDREQTAPVEVNYFTSGLTWAADYVALLNGDESAADLEGWVKVYNSSGETYEEAQTRLVVGTINLVEGIAELARRYQDRAGRRMQEKLKAAEPKAIEENEGDMMDMMRAPAARPKEIIKEGLSEYFIYTIEGTETIPDAGARRMISLKRKGVPVAMTYKLDPKKYGEVLWRFITTKNDEKSKLGKEPLPNGIFRVFKNESGGRKAFVGQAMVDYVPVGEDIEVNLGADAEVTFEEKMKDFRRENLHYSKKGGGVDGQTQIRTYEITVKNAKTTSAKFEIRRIMSGEWAVETSQKYEKIDKDTIEFKFDLKPNLEKVITYVVTEQIGVNAAKENSKKMGLIEEKKKRIGEILSERKFSGDNIGGISQEQYLKQLRQLEEEHRKIEAEIKIRKEQKKEKKEEKVEKK